MKSFGILVVLQILVIVGFCKKVRIPSYIKPCSKSDPAFEKCCLDHGKEALPHIFKGDKKMGIPNMLPLVIPEVNVNAGNNLKIFLTDIHVYGLDTTDLKQVKIDIDKLHIALKLDIARLELIGKYEIDGKIMVLAIKGRGDMNLTAIGGEYIYDLNYNLGKKNGEEYIELTDKDNLVFTLQGVKINFDNLFDGDKILGDQMNIFLNENWREVLNEFGLAISETIRSIGRSIASAYFKKIPYHDLFLD